MKDSRSTLRTASLLLLTTLTFIISQFKAKFLPPPQLQMKPSAALIPHNHNPLLTTSTKAGGSPEALAKGNKKISDKRKGRSLLIQYYRTRKRLKSESSKPSRLSFFDRCSNLQDHFTLNREAQWGLVAHAGASQETHGKRNKKISDKRKGGNACIQYYRMRKRIKSESFKSPYVSFFDRCSYFQDRVTLSHEGQVGDAMFSDCLANNFGSITTTDLVDKLNDGCRESVQNDYINGSMREGELYKPTENVCHLLRDNLTGIEPKDGPHMHKDDPYSLLSISNMDNVLCILNTEDTIENIPDSQLLDSPKSVLEDSSFDGDQQDICHWESDVESPSVSNVDPVKLNEGDIICILNAEDPEIPCNDNVFMHIHPLHSIDWASSFDRSQLDCPDLSPEFDYVSMDHSPSLSDHNSDSDSDLPFHPVSPFTQTQMDGPDLSSTYDSADQHFGYTLMDHNPCISDRKDAENVSDLHSTPDIEGKFICILNTEDSEIPCNDIIFSPVHPSPSVRPQTDIEGKFICILNTEDSEIPCNDIIFSPVHPSPSVRPQTDTDSIDPSSSLTLSQIDGPYLSSEFSSENPHAGYTPKSLLMYHNPCISDHNNSDSDCELQHIPIIEDPEIPSNNNIFLLIHPSPYVRLQMTTYPISPTSWFTQPQLDGPDLSSEFGSRNLPVGNNLISCNPSISDSNNPDSDIDLPYLPVIEYPEIPCNDNNFLPIHPSSSVKPQTDTDSIDPASSLNQSQMIGPNLSSEFNYANPLVCNNINFVSTDSDPSISDHDSDLPCFPDTKNLEILCNDNMFLLIHPSPSAITQIATVSVDPTSSFTPSQMDAPDLSFEFVSPHPHGGNAIESVSMDHNPSISDHENSDSESDLSCIPDIEALILKLDSEYAQDSWITNEVKRRKYKHSKWTINNMEQSSLARAMPSLGAFAVFSSGHFNYFIKKTEVTIGRSTDDTEVDIDLRKESQANMISRKQAIINMETDGTFTLKNIGKGSILVKGSSISNGQVAALSSSCLIQIRGMDFMFEINDSYVRWYLDNTIKKTQGKFSAFEWPVTCG